jgi:hypothetical protein
MDGYRLIRLAVRSAFSHSSATSGVSGLEVRSGRAARSSVIGRATTRASVEVLGARAASAAAGALEVEANVDSVGVGKLPAVVPEASRRGAVP